MAERSDFSVTSTLMYMNVSEKTREGIVLRKN